MNKPLYFEDSVRKYSELAFKGKHIRLIYSIDVPSPSSIWWKEYRGFDNVKLFPENELSLSQEIGYIKRLVDSDNTEPLLIITKSPFILQEFPQNCVTFAKLDEQSMCKFIPCPKSTYGIDILDIIRLVSDGRVHPNINNVLYYIPMDEYYNVINVGESSLDNLDKWNNSSSAKNSLP